MSLMFCYNGNNTFVRYVSKPAHLISNVIAVFTPDGGARIFPPPLCCGQGSNSRHLSRVLSTQDPQPTELSRRWKGIKQNSFRSTGILFACCVPATVCVLLFR